MKIGSMGAELFHADRRTGMTKLTVVTAILRTGLQIQFPVLNLAIHTQATQL